MYSVQEFIDDARAILKGKDPLEQKQRAIGERMLVLARRDDLVEIGTRTGPSEVTSDTIHLYRDQTSTPPVGLLLVQFAPGFSSPVHGHGTYWVVGCGYRGRDRWDVYERLDDGTKPGYADLKLVDQVSIPPGTYAIMPEPPGAIHSHNGVAPVDTLELIFTGSVMDVNARLNYDVKNKTYAPSAVMRRGSAAMPAYRPREPGLTLLRPVRRPSLGCPICAPL